MPKRKRRRPYVYKDVDMTTIAIPRYLKPEIDKIIDTDVERRIKLLQSQQG